MSKKKTTKKSKPVEADTVVESLVLAGCGKTQIREFLILSLEYKPAPAELAKMIDAAKLAIRNQAVDYVESSAEMTIVRLNDLYTRAIKGEDVKTALAIEVAIAKHISKLEVVAPDEDDDVEDENDDRANGTVGRIG